MRWSHRRPRQYRVSTIRQNYSGQRFDEAHHGTSAALEFGICYLEVKHLVILGHSQCGGIEAVLGHNQLGKNDFLTNWLSLLDIEHTSTDPDQFSQQALLYSYQNCLTFPWIKHAIDAGKLIIHLWFFQISQGKILNFCFKDQVFKPLEENAPLT